MSDLHDLTATQQLRALHTREISSRDLTGHYLERIAQLDGELGAFATVDPESALQEADRADERLARGERSPLSGLPIGIKDLHATAGMRTAFGSAPLTDHVPTDDSWTVGLLRQAGAVLVGKTSASELGATCFTENPLDARPALTPYAPGRYSSGSSGGAATAVAAGLLPLAHGSDGAGSIRTPAATCHLVGMKPSRGLVSPAPAVSYFNPGTEGPLTRTVADAAVLLDVMAQPSPGDLYGWRPSTGFVDTLRQGLTRRLKVAVWTATGLDGVAPHPQAVLAVQRTADRLRELGHDVREVPLPAPCTEPVQTAIRNWFSFGVSAAVSAAVPADREHQLQPYTRHLLAAGRDLTGDDVIRTQSILARYASAHLATLEGFDVALTPTTNGPPVPVGHYLADGVEGVADRMLAWSCHTPWANLTGQPAVSVPSHLDADGLPHAVQFVGRRRQDTELLALAAQLEEAAHWDDVHPLHWHR